MKALEQSVLSSTEMSRDRGTELEVKTVGGGVSPVKDNSRSPAGKRRDVPLPPPPAVGQDSQDGLKDPADLPPPPPELLHEGGGSFVDAEAEQHSDDP